jgi:exocyst complex component 2
MADFERTVLEHYQLPTAYPEEWPAEKDLSDASSDEEFAGRSKRIGMVRRSKSRYSALERSASDRRSLVPGSQKTGDGVENLVQKDELDPLGTSDSVVRILKQQGLPVQDDTNLRKHCRMLRDSLLIAFFRKQIFTVVNYLFSCVIPLSSPQKCVDTVSPARS